MVRPSLTFGELTGVNDLDAIEMAQLSEMENLIVVVSTYGEGEMPDNAQLFWEAVSASIQIFLHSV